MTMTSKPENSALPQGDEVREIIATMAAPMVDLHLNALEMFREQGLQWQHVAFANLLSLRSLGMIVEKMDEPKVQAELAQVIEKALKQPMLTKHFKNETEMKAWAVEQGLAKPEGPAR